MSIILLSCIGTDTNVSNVNLLCHFIDHYQSLGITTWALTIHMGSDARLHNADQYQEILDSYGIRYEVWHGEFNTYEREAKHNTFVNAQDDDAWIVGVDLDELIDFPIAIPQYLERVASAGFNCVVGDLVDRVSSSGELLPIKRHPSIAKQFPLIAEVKRNIYQPAFPVAPFEKKIAIRKPLQWGLGHHFITRETRQAAKESPERLIIHHYAWDRLLIPRIQQRLGDSWAQEYRNMISYIAQHGRIVLADVQDSAHETKG